jgi:hypothetical protein
VFWQQATCWQKKWRVLKSGEFGTSHFFSGEFVLFFFEKVAGFKLATFLVASFCTHASRDFLHASKS